MSEDGYTRITLRIPTALDERLNEAAKLTSKSKNAEIVARLESSMNTNDEQALILKLMDRIERLTLLLEDARVERSKNEC